MFDLEIFNILKQIDWINWIKAIFLLLIGIFSAKITVTSFNKITSQKLSHSYQLLLGRAIFFFIILIFTSSALQQIGFDISALLGAAGVITIIIGIAAQSSLGNLFAGISLLFEHTVKIGDMIKINDIWGEVINVTLFSVKICTVDGAYMQIPNENIIKSQILNYSYFPNRRIDLIVKVPYTENLYQIEEILLEIAANNEMVLTQPKAFVQTNRFLDLGYEIFFFCWTKNDNYGVVTHRLIQEIQKHFLKNNIQFIYNSVKILSK